MCTSHSTRSCFTHAKCYQLPDLKITCCFIFMVAVVFCTSRCPVNIFKLIKLIQPTKGNEPKGSTEQQRNGNAQQPRRRVKRQLRSLPPGTEKHSGSECEGPSNSAPQFRVSNSCRDVLFALFHAESFTPPCSPSSSLSSPSAFHSSCL